MKDNVTIADDERPVPVIHENWILLTLLTAAFLTRLAGIQSQSLSVDEAGTWLTSIRPLVQIIPHMIRTGEVHPPLYFIAMHFWMKLGTTEWILRSSSVIAGLLTIYLTYILAKILVNRNAALWSACLISFSSFHAALSREYRMYPLLTFFYLFSILYFYRWLEKGERRKLALFTIANIAALYTHYLAVFILAVENIYFILQFSRYKGLVKPHLAGQIITAIAYLPWIIFFLSHSHGQDFTLRFAPGISHLFSLFSQFFLGPGLPPRPVPLGAFTLTPYSIAGFALLALSLYSLRLLPIKSRTLSGLYLLLPLLSVTLLSHYTRIRIFEYKYFLIITPAFFIALGAYFSTVNSRAIRLVMLAAFLIFNVISWSNNTWDSRYGPQNWKLASHILQYYVRKGDVIVIHPSMMSEGIYYYYSGNAKILPVDEINEAQFARDLAPYERIWFCFTPFHPYVERLRLDQWFRKNYSETSLTSIPVESFVPSNVIFIKTYEKKDAENNTLFN